MTTAHFVNTEIPRDRFGRPMVIAPGAKTKRISYRRVTTFVGILEDQNGLTKWKQRQTVVGMGQRKDLVLAAAACNPENKKLLNELADQAMDYALSSSGATTGTALHSLTERIDRGQELGYVPAEYAADIAAYQTTTQGIEWTDVESFRVHDEFQVAGTADRIGWHNGRLRIFDIKSGSIDYPHKMAMQLAMYARSLPYDIPTDKRGTDPADIDLNTGIIIHLPAGQGRCDLYEIDIMKGWGACLIARQAWKWRGEKHLTHRIGDDRTSVWEKANQAAPVSEDTPWSERIKLADNIEHLRDIWTRARAAGALTEDLRALCTERSRELQNTK